MTYATAFCAEICTRLYAWVSSKAIKLSQFLEDKINCNVTDVTLTITTCTSATNLLIKEVEYHHVIVSSINNPSDVNNYDCRRLKLNQIFALVIV